jgi:hypothetical protein
LGDAISGFIRTVNRPILHFPVIFYVARFQIFMAVKIQVEFFWFVTPCSVLWWDNNDTEVRAASIFSMDL